MLARGFRAVAQAESHLRADHFHVCELGLESCFGPGSDGIGFVERGLGFVVPPQRRQRRRAIGLIPPHADPCAERLVDPITLVEMREGFGVQLLVVAEKDADAGVSRRQSRRVA